MKEDARDAVHLARRNSEAYAKFEKAQSLYVSLCAAVGKSSPEAKGARKAAEYFYGVWEAEASATAAPYSEQLKAEANELVGDMNKHRGRAPVGVVAAIKSLSLMSALGISAVLLGAFYAGTIITTLVGAH